MEAPRVSRSKYGNRVTQVDGRNFSSVREANRYIDLVMQQRAGLIRDLKCQVRYPLHVNGLLVTTYVADFEYLKDGVLVTEDSKGFRTPAYQIKAKLFHALLGREILET